MNRTDRLYAIREELRRAGSRGRTAEQLATGFEVSTRTIKRDISALQAAGFPIWVRTGRTGGYVVEREATLPPVALTPSEVSGLAVALAASHRLPFGAEARAALVKIAATTSPALRERIERLSGRVWVNEDEHPAAGGDPRVVGTIGDGLAEGRTLSIQYRDAADALTYRRVDPQLLALNHGQWYLVAHCHLRQGIRWFRTDRIVSARLTNRRSIDRPVEDNGEPPPTARALDVV
jgi:predicted DNA-binding transcriptional regulator YafY